MDYGQERLPTPTLEPEYQYKKVEPYRDPYTGEVKHYQREHVRQFKALTDESLVDYDTHDAKINTQTWNKLQKDLGINSESFADAAKYVDNATYNSKNSRAVSPEVAFRFHRILRQIQLLVNVIGNPNDAFGTGAKEGEEGFLPPNVVLDNKIQRDYVEAIGKVARQVTDIERKAKEAEETGQLAEKLALGNMKGIIAQLIAIDLDYQIKKIEQDLVAAGKSLAEAQAEAIIQINDPSKPRDEFAMFNEVSEIANKFMFKNYKYLTDPQNFNDLLGLIMLTAGPEYAPGGKRQLKDREGNLHRHNFLKWLEDEMWYFSDFQDDGEFSGYQYIAFYTVYRQISMFEMIVTQPEKYFARETKLGETYIDGKPVYDKVDYKDDKEQQRLRDYCVALITPANVIHMNDYKYTLGLAEKGNETWMNMMKEIYSQQALTFNSRFLRFLGLLATEEEEVEEYLRSDRDQARIGGTLGLAMSRALLMHYYIDQLALRGSGSDLRKADGSFEWEKDKDNNDIVGTYANTFLKVLGDDFRRDKKGNIMYDKLGNELMGGRRAFFQTLIAQAITRSTPASMLATRGGEGGSFESLLAEYKDLLNSFKDRNDDGSYKELSYSKIFQKLKEDFAREDKSVIRQMWTKVAVNDSEPLEKIANILKNNNPGFAAEQELAFAMLKVFLGVSRKDLNFYDGPKAGQRQLRRNVTLDAIRAAIQAEHGLNSTDSRFAAHWASLMPWFMGIAAKNDPQSDSMQYWTTVMQFRDYRLKNLNSKVDIGDPDTLNTINNFLTFMEGIPISLKIWDKGKKEYVDKIIPILEYIQGSTGRGEINLTKYNNTDYPAKPVIVDNAMRNFFEMMIKGMVSMDQIIKKDGFDFADVHRKGIGNTYIEDPEKSKKFYELLSGLRNVFTKPAFKYLVPEVPKGNDWTKWTYEDMKNKNIKIMMRRMKEDRNGNIIYLDKEEKNPDYEFVEVPIIEFMLHRDILDADYNHSSKKLGAEEIVKKIIGHLTAISYDRHAWRLTELGLTEEQKKKASKWEIWTPERFQAVDNYLINQIALKVGLDPNANYKKYVTKEGYFNKADIKAIHKVSKTLMGPMELRSGSLNALGSIFLLLWFVLTHGWGEASKFK